MEFAGHVSGGRAGDPQFGLRARTVGDHAAVHSRQNLLDVLVVEAQNGRAIKRNLCDERRERCADLFDARVVIQMLAVDVGDDRDDRRQLQKRPVAFVAFDHQVIAFSQARVGAVDPHAAADQDGRVQICVDQNRRDHRSSGGLAVAAGDGDPEFLAHQLGQQLAAWNHGKLAAARLDDFRILRTHRRAVHYHLGSGQICCRVTFVNHRSPRSQTLRGGRKFQIRTGHADSPYPSALRPGCSCQCLRCR